MKFVSAGVSGSMQMVTPQAATAGMASRKVSAAQRKASRAPTSDGNDRCMGEPNTMIEPPRSRHASASATR
jgi:hypothetical protein